MMKLNRAISYLFWICFPFAYSSQEDQFDFPYCYEHLYTPIFPSTKKVGFTLVKWYTEASSFKGLAIDFGTIVVDPNIKSLLVSQNDKPNQIEILPQSASFEIFQVAMDNNMREPKPMVTMVTSHEEPNPPLSSSLGQGDTDYILHTFARIKKPVESKHAVFIIRNGHSSRLLFRANTFLTSPPTTAIDTTTSKKISESHKTREIFSNNKEHRDTVTNKTFNKPKETKVFEFPRLDLTESQNPSNPNESGLSKLQKSQVTEPNNTFTRYSNSRKTTLTSPKTTSEMDTDVIFTKVYPGDIIIYVPWEVEDQCGKEFLDNHYVNNRLLSLRCMGKEIQDLPKLPFQALVMYVGPEHQNVKDMMHIMSRLYNINELVIYQRWFFQSDEITHQAIFPPSTKPRSRFRLAISHLYDGRGPFELKFETTYYALKITHNYLTIHSHSHPQDRLTILLSGPYLMVIVNLNVPFHVAVIRMGRILSCISNHGQKIQVRPSDRILIYPKGCREEHRLKLSFVESPNLDINGFKTALKGHIIVAEIREDNLNGQLPHRTHRYIIPIEKEGPRLAEVAWIAPSSLILPTSVALNEKSIFFGDIFDDLAFTFLPNTSMQRKLGSVFSERLQNRAFYDLSAVVISIKDSKSIRFSAFLTPKVSYSIFLRRWDENLGQDKRIFLDFLKYEEKTSPLTMESNIFDYLPGDTFEIYRNGDLEILKNGFPTKSQPFIIEELADSLPIASVMALQMTIDKRQSGQEVSNVNHLLYFDNMTRINYWFFNPNPIQSAPVSLLKGVNQNKKHRCRLNWISEGRLECEFMAKYEYFGVIIGPTRLLISNQLCLRDPCDKNIVSLEIDFKDHQLNFKLQGAPIPFTVAIYRKDVLMVSWGGSSFDAFDDFILGDMVVVIPWIAFLNHKISTTIAPFASRNDLYAGLSNGFSRDQMKLVAIIEEAHGNDLLNPPSSLSSQILNTN